MYSKKDLEWLKSINKDNIEVLINCDNIFQWVMFSDGVIKTNTLVYDHRKLGEDTGIENKIQPTSIYVTNNNAECLI
jgi:hypothetical protein